MTHNQYPGGQDEAGLPLLPSNFGKVVEGADVAGANFIPQITATPAYTEERDSQQAFSRPIHEIPLADAIEAGFIRPEDIPEGWVSNPSATQPEQQGDK